jgi:tripartite-type tricarboxylate transporter receptor subunit TctC
MDKTMTCRLLLAAASALALTLVQAQDYPSRPIKIIVPYPPGGSADLVPRAIVDELRAKWGQPVLVENHPGAGGNVGAESVYRAEPDGYTLLATPPGPLVVNQNLYRNLRFDPSKFVPVVVLAEIPNVLLVNPKMNAFRVKDIIDYARANPDKLNYGSQGSGTTSHLTAELFKSAAGVRITHVPYKGSAPAMAALLAGEIDLMFDNLGVTLPQVKAGRLRAIAVCSENRVSPLPGVATMSEILPGFISSTWVGVVAPPGTPAAIADRLSAALSEAIRAPDVQKRLAALSAEPVGGTPARMASFTKFEEQRWKRVIETAKVQVD